MKKLTSKDVKWCAGDVCAVVEHTGSVRRVFNQHPIDNGDVNEFHSTKVNQYHKEDFYIVMRDDAEKPEEKSLVYTKEMYDANLKPVSGMRVKANCGNECVIEFAGRFIALVTFDGGPIEQPIDVRDLSPIETRTPEQKQVDEVAEFMLKHGRHTDASGLVKLMQEQGMLKTVIKSSKDID